LKASSWDVPGSAVAEVANAVAELYRVYVPEPYVLFVGPGRCAKLVAVEERTGVMELTRVRSLVKDVVDVPQLPRGCGSGHVHKPRCGGLGSGRGLRDDVFRPR
jgi:uncharacterized linocin/CFP29 family protein